MERTCTSRSKILLNICILPIWEVKLEDLGTLTPYLPYKGRFYVHGILVSPT